MNSADKDKKFSLAMARLYACYPGYSKGELRDAVTAWFAQLRQFDLRVVEQALEDMPALCPNMRFPRLSDVLVRCRYLVGVQRELAEKEAREERQRRDDEEHGRLMAEVPTDPGRQHAWIARGRNECERLARTWMCESKTEGRGSNYKYSREQIRQRLRDLFAAMDVTR